ncbi:hypothetical protein GMST_13420 [Geomonas silvestris]|uniref:Uncharacterized protein n=1 Tax=Geomonas silvestris TaxID=2740184 RepID=A0A6V8MGD5_9BACT|nr:hypothetical protein GMST_13420 [Geomonas silvestris]
MGAGGAVSRAITDGWVGLQEVIEVGRVIRVRARARDRLGVDPTLPPFSTVHRGIPGTTHPPSLDGRGPGGG